MNNIKEYDEFINEFRSYNISLTEKDYEELLKNGIVNISSGVPGDDSFTIAYEPTVKLTKRGTISLSLDEFIKLSSGDIIDRGSIKLALQDIGFNRIMSLRKKYKK
jgi:hypothetical protein